MHRYAYWLAGGLQVLACTGPDALAVEDAGQEEGHTSVPPADGSEADADWKPDAPRVLPDGAYGKHAMRKRDIGW